MEEDDKPMTDRASKPSRLSRHYAILGFNGDSMPEHELAAERHAMREAKPLPLHFSAFTEAPVKQKAWLRQLFSRPRMAWTTAAVLAAACIGLIIMQREGKETPPWQIMGGIGIQVFYEQDGQVHPWNPQVTLREGARLKAEVQAVEPTIAFWGVASRDGRLLSDPAWVLQSRIELKASERKTFSGSLQLDGASEGETLVVIACPVDIVGSVSDLSRSLQLAIVSAAMPESLHKCRSQRFRLRQ